MISKGENANIMAICPEALQGNTYEESNTRTYVIMYMLTASAFVFSIFHDRLQALTFWPENQTPKSS